jgi:spore maturation protein CgeB
MKVFYHIPHPDVNGAERWIYEAWKAGFTQLGFDVYILRFEDNIFEKIKLNRPDIFITDISVIDLNIYGNFLNEIRLKGSKVAILTHWPLVGSAYKNKTYLMHNNCADLYFGERISDAKLFERDTNKQYICIPNAANPEHHFPVAPSEDFASDILYIGSNLPHKKWFKDNILNNLLKNKKYKVRIIGRGWTSYDLILRVLRKILIHLNFIRLKKIVEKLTIKISDDDERNYYSSAKICLNFHEREPDGSQPHYIVNQRSFKIPACGGFQICDDVGALRDYFLEGKEIVLLPLDKKKWLETIEYYLLHSEERENIRRRGSKKALKFHMATNRCLTMLSYLGISHDRKI